MNDELKRISKQYKYGIKSRTNSRKAKQKLKSWLDDNYENEFTTQIPPFLKSNNHDFFSSRLRIIIDIDFPEVFFDVPKYRTSEENKTIMFEILKGVMVKNVICIRVYLFDVVENNWQTQLKIYIDSISKSFPNEQFMHIQSNIKCVNDMYEEIKNKFVDSLSSLTIVDSSRAITLDHFFKNKNDSHKVIINDDAEIAKQDFNAWKYENIIWSYLQTSRISSDMGFDREFTGFTTRYKYDFASTKCKVVIELDDRSHFYSIWGSHYSLIKKQEKDKKKNALAHKKCYTIIRIEQLDGLLLSNHDTWKYELDSCLYQIKNGYIRNAFIPFAKSDIAKLSYCYQSDALFGLNTLLKKYSPRQNIINPCTTTTHPNKIFAPAKKTSVIGGIAQDIQMWINENHKDLQLEAGVGRHLFGTGMGRRTFTFGIVSKKLIIVLDYTFFEQLYEKSKTPCEVRESEFDKALIAIKQEYRIIRIYYGCVKNSHLWKQSLSLLIDNPCDINPCTWIDTQNPTYESIYEHFNKCIASLKWTPYQHPDMT